MGYFYNLFFKKTLKLKFKIFIFIFLQFILTENKTEHNVCSISDRKDCLFV